MERIPTAMDKCEVLFGVHMGGELLQGELLPVLPVMDFISYNVAPTETAWRFIFIRLRHGQVTREKQSPPEVSSV